MRRISSILLLILTAVASIWYCFFIEEEFSFVYQQKNWVVTEIGIPSKEHYSDSHPVSRNPWDMTVFDGCLYVGNGDYDKNTGPVPIWRYDPKLNTWENSGIINDEAVAKFIELDGQLIAPGIDPKDNHDFGNYYVLGNNKKWQTVSTVPNGVHMFDIVKHNDEIFYALGNGSYAHSPIVKTADNKTFTPLDMYSENRLLTGDSLLGHSRCYGLFSISNRLFALCVWPSASFAGFFEYDGTRFNLVSHLKDHKLSDFSVSRQVWFNEKAVYDNVAYISFGSFYKTVDFKTLERIATPNDSVVQDIVLYDGKMYVLTVSQNNRANNTDHNENTLYTNAIYEYCENIGFNEILSFQYKAPAMSFCMDGNTIYVGIGKNDPTVKKDNPIGTVIGFAEENYIIIHNKITHR